MISAQPTAKEATDCQVLQLLYLIIFNFCMSFENAFLLRVRSIVILEEATQHVRDFFYFLKPLAAYTPILCMGWHGSKMRSYNYSSRKFYLYIIKILNSIKMYNTLCDVKSAIPYLRLRIQNFNTIGRLSDNFNILLNIVTQEYPILFSHIKLFDQLIN